MLAACSDDPARPSFDAPSIGTTSLPSGVENVAYAPQALVATGGDGSYNWFLASASGPLPAGLTLSSDGVLAGTPTAQGTFDFTVQVTSALQTTGQDLSITVYGALQLTTSALPSAVSGQAFSVTLAAAGGSSDHTWAVALGDLPDGLDLDASTGAISGTPTTPGSSTFTAEVTSGDGQSSQAELTLDVYDPLQVTTSALPDGVAADSYSEMLSATGGDGSYTWSWTGSTPNGLSLASDGAISGTPTTPGPSNFTVEAMSSDGQSAQQALSITVVPGAPDADQSSLTVGATDILANGFDPATVTVTVRDVLGNVVPGATVVLGVTGSGNSITQPASVTGGSGVASGSFTATVAELKTVSATADGTAIVETQDVTSHASHALDFTSEYVAIPDAADLDLTAEWTLEAWIKPTDVNATVKHLVSKWDSCSKASYTMELNGAQLRSSIGSCGNGTQIVETPPLLVADEWQHVAITLVSDTLRLYVDGALEATQAGSIAPIDTDTDVWIGQQTGGGLAFDGLIDEVRIWQVARTGAELLASKDARLLGSEAGLVAYWRLDEGSGDIAVDETGRGNDGRLGSAVGTDASDPAWSTDSAPISY